VACGGGSKAGGVDAMPADITDARPGPDAAGIRAEVFASFGSIETLAGTAQIESKGENGWQASFEGGAATSAELSRPHMTMADSAGNLYIADKDAHGLRKVSPGGVITTVAGTSVAGDDGDGPALAVDMRLSSPNGLWVSESDTVYLLDLGNDKVRRVRDGSMSTLFTIGGAGTGRGLWVADDESLAYVAAGSVLKKWTPEEGIQTLATGFSSLGNFYVESDGNLLVTDRFAHRVYRVSPDGDKQVVAGNGQTSGGGDGQAALDTGLNEVRGVWAEPSGGFFVATHRGGQVWYVDGAGAIHLFVDGDSDDSHAGDGLAFDDPLVRISEPRAISMDRQGNLLITEHDGGFIRRVNRN
jgi:sugar lactone lactonase YvrE